MTQDPPDGVEAADQAKSGDDPFAREALDWFVRLQAAASDPATSRAFRAWLEGDRRRAEAFEKVTAVWGAPEFLQATKNVAKATGFAVPSKKSRRGALAKKAAVVTSAVIVAFGLTKTPDLKLWFEADYSTSTGQQQRITLPDGSRMILNTSSAVALDFSERQRGVKLLKGEAYFDVLPETKPFRVAGHFGNVDVKGTAFAVRLDRTEDSVLLTRGKVDVARRDQPKDHTSLSPGEGTSVTGT